MHLTSITLPAPEPGSASPVLSFSYDGLNRLLTQTDALGSVTSFEYDVMDRLVERTGADPDGAGPLTSPVTGWAWDDASQLTSTTDALGRVTGYQYDALGRLLAVVQGTGAGGSTVEIIDNGDAGFSTTGSWSTSTGQGHEGSVRYSAAGSGADKATWTFDGLSAGTYRVAATWSTHANRATDAPYTVRDGTTPLGTVDVNQELAPDDFSDAGTSWEILGEFAISGDELVVELSDEASQYVIADAIRIERIDAPPTWSYEYDVLGNITKTVDPLGNFTTYGYDNLSRLTSVTLPDPDGAGSLTSPVYSYSYDGASRLTSVAGPLGRVTSYQYDHIGRRTKVVLPDPDGAGSQTSPQWTTGYDANGNITSVTDPLGRSTSYEYDALNRRTKQTQPDPDGAGSLTAPVTEWAYDLAGQLTTLTDALGSVTSYVHDGLGRVVGVTLPDPDDTGPLSAPVYTASYDAAGNLLTRTNPENETTSYAYDKLHRLTTVTDANTGVTAYQYDGAGNLTKLTDAENNDTTFLYDDLDRLISETNELGKSLLWTYDDAGNVTTATDRNGRVREFSYDNLYRLTEERWKDGANTVNTIAFVYDAASQLASASDDFSSYSYLYDGLGRVTEVDNSGTPGVPDVVLTSSFDAAGNRTALAAEVGGTADFVNAYQYDALDRMTRIEQTDGAPSAGSPVSDKRIDLAYNPLGQFDSITRYADLSGIDLVAASTYSYDDAHRLTDLTHSKGANTLADYAWTYDDAGRVATMTSDDGTTTYSYDAASQLTGADHSYQTDETYTYTATGGREDADYDTGTNNRLLTDGTHTYQHDDNGNRTRKTTIATGDYVSYEWDHRNRLVAVEFRTSTNTLTKKVEFDYDLFDRLIAKRVDDDGNGTFDRGQSFVYDGLDVVLVFDDAGSLENRFLHGPAVDQVLATEDGSGDVLWPLADNQGTIRDLADYDAGTDATSVVNHLKYDSFGNVTAESNASASPMMKFTGRYYDEDVDLQWNWQRWYDPQTGLWLSEDPLGFAAGDANLVRYVVNSPANGTDPSGLRTESTVPEYGWELPLNPFTDPEAFARVADMNSSSSDDGWDIDWMTVTRWTAEIGSLLPVAGEVRDVGELMLGRDIWGNELTGMDRVLTGVGLALPMVPTSALRRTGRFVGERITDPMATIRPIQRIAEQLDDPLKRVAELPIINQAFDVPDEFLKKIDETRACFVAGTQVVVVDAVAEEVAAMSTPATAEADDGLSTLALVAATVPVALTGYGRLRRRKRREPLSELDELFSADDLFPEPSAPPPREQHTTPADPPRRPARSRFGPTLALAWLVGWLAIGGFLFVQGTAPADRPGAAPAVAASAPVEEAPAYRTKNIEDLQPDELVLAADPQSGRVEPKRVLEVYRRTSNHLRLLTFADRSGREQRIETTDEHPFWVPDRDEFVDAGDLSAGDKVVGPHGEIQWLVATNREPHPEGIEVFNFKVEDFHTYFVAAQGRRGPPVLAHNSDGCIWTPSEYDDWFDSLPTRSVAGNEPQDIFQRSVAGDTERLIQGLDARPVWADGLDGTTILEAKYVRNPDTSPQLGNSSEFFDMIYLEQQIDELDRYRNAILDMDNPLESLQIIISDPMAFPYWEELLRRMRIPGEVIVPR